MMKEYEIDYGSFIGGWYIPEKVCDDLIELYNTSKGDWEDGRIGSTDISGKIDEKTKKSTELYLFPHDFIKLPTYLPHLNNCLDAYKKRYYYSNKVYHYGINTTIKIQHYKPGEGFYDWHMENTGVGESKNRHLVFMTYLNTLDNAGTEFHHQKTTTPCQKGLTLIWPAHWTHTHRGVVNHDSDKYIITGWYNFYDK